MSHPLRFSLVVYFLVVFSLFFVVGFVAKGGAVAQGYQAPPLTPELLASIFAGLWSLILGYVPPVADWFEKLTAREKQSVTAVGLLVISIFVVVLSCTGYLTGMLACPSWTVAIENAIAVFIAALMANQSVYLITKRSN